MARNAESYGREESLCQPQPPASVPLCLKRRRATWVSGGPRFEEDVDYRYQPVFVGTARIGAAGARTLHEHALFGQCTTELDWHAPTAPRYSSGAAPLEQPRTCATPAMYCRFTPPRRQIQHDLRAGASPPHKTCRVLEDESSAPGAPPTTSCHCEEGAGPRGRAWPLCPRPQYLQRDTWRRSCQASAPLRLRKRAPHGAHQPTPSSRRVSPADERKREVSQSLVRPEFDQPKFGLNMGAVGRYSVCLEPHLAARWDFRGPDRAGPAIGDLHV